jgi:hypothetical protein
MAYNAAEISALYARSVALYSNSTPLSEITTIDSIEYNDEICGFTYNCSGPKGSVTVYIMADPDSGEFIATCDY